MNKRYFLFATALLLLLPSVPVLGRVHVRDSSSTRNDIREYTEEIGFFQKANRDIGDPRFMFADEGGNYDFGVGGKVSISGYFGFSGAAEDVKFNPSCIAVPTDNTYSFGTKAFGSYVHFKARAKLGKEKMIAYFRIGGSVGDGISIKQAYISYHGFSVGKIPSYFMDIRVGSMTTGIGPDTPVDNTHTLFGYIRRFNPHWSAAIALEKAEFDLDQYDYADEIRTDYQPMPDIAGHVKYKWDKGHVQVGYLYRRLSYWSIKEKPKTDAEGWSGRMNGFGVSVSGNYNPSDKLKFSIQYVTGVGIADYVSNLADLHINAGLYEKVNDYRTMKTIPVSDGFISAQYNWSKDWSATLMTGYSRQMGRKEVQSYNSLKYSAYALGNVFYYMKDFGYAGLEYIYAHKKIGYPGAGSISGNASRIVFVVSFVF